MLLLDEPLSAHELRTRHARTVAVLHDRLMRQHAALDELYHRPADLLVARVLDGLQEVPGEVVGGRHRSAPGEVPVARAVGAAVMLVRQEVVGLVPATPLVLGAAPCRACSDAAPGCRSRCC